MEGNLAYASVIFIANIKILTSTAAHNIVSLGLVFLSILSFFGCSMVMNILPMMDLYGSLTIMVFTREFWLCLVLTTLALSMVDYGLNYFNHSFFKKIFIIARIM